MDGYESNLEEYDVRQKNEIELGKKEGLNTSFYEDNRYLEIQMRQIRMGLENGVDVSKYADPEFDWFQMEEIRIGLEEQLDVSKYAEKELPFQNMRQIRIGLKQGIDLSNFKKLDAGILKELRKAVYDNVEIVKYISAGYDVEQLKEIRHALAKKINIEPYLNKEIRGVAIRQIWKTLESGLDPTCFCSEEYNWQQMQEIRFGMEQHIEYEIYMNPLYGYQQMREIRLGLMESLDVSLYKSFVYDAASMRQKRLELLQERDKTSKTNAEVYTSLKNLPAGVSLSIEDNDMKAYLILNTVLEQFPTRKEMLQILNNCGVFHGILEDKIELLLAGKVLQKKFLIAQGTEPENGKDAFYEYMFETEEISPIDVDKDEIFNFNAIKVQKSVKKGDVIAIYHRATKGTAGYTVKGIRKPQKMGKELIALKGNGFSLSEDKRTYMATSDGMIDIVNGRINIVPLLELEDVNPTTGNVNFDGCVHVKGSVTGNVEIRATGDIIIDHVLNGGTLKGEKNILIRKGANSGNEAEHAVIIAKGSLGCGYLEGVKVHVLGGVYVNTCLHADIFAIKEIIVNGRNGKIVGGSVMSASKILSQSVGNSSGIPTKISIGISQKETEKEQKIISYIQEIDRQIEILTNMYEKYQKLYDVAVRNTMSEYLKIENAIYTRNEEKGKLLNKMKELQKIHFVNNDAYIEISGTVNAGTEIEIQEYKLDIEGMMQNVTFRKVGKKLIPFKNGEK